MKKYFKLTSLCIMLLLSTISYSTEVPAGAKEFEVKGKEFVTLVEQILKDKKQGIQPTEQQIKRVKALLPYHPKKYKGNIIDELTKKTINPQILPEPVQPVITPEAEEDIDVILVKLQDGQALPQYSRGEQGFLDVFGEFTNKFINDLQIDAAKKDKFLKILDDITQKIIDGRKIYPGRDIGKITAAIKKEENRLKRELTNKEAQDIINKLYPKEKLDKLRKMARNKLANEIVETYLEDLSEQLTNLKNERQKLEAARKKILDDKSKNPSQDTTIIDKMTSEINKLTEKINKLEPEIKKNILEYRAKLINSLKPMAANPTRDYNPEKIEFLQDTEEPTYMPAAIDAKPETLEMTLKKYSNAELFERLNKLINLVSKCKDLLKRKGALLTADEIKRIKDGQKSKEDEIKLINKEIKYIRKIKPPVPTKKPISAQEFSNEIMTEFKNMSKEDLLEEFNNTRSMIKTNEKYLEENGPEKESAEAYLKFFRERLKKVSTEMRSRGLKPIRPNIKPSVPVVQTPASGVIIYPPEVPVKPEPIIPAAKPKELSPFDKIKINKLRELIDRAITETPALKEEARVKLEELLALDDIKLLGKKESDIQKIIDPVKFAQQETDMKNTKNLAGNIVLQDIDNDEPGIKKEDLGSLFNMMKENFDKINPDKGKFFDELEN